MFLFRDQPSYYLNLQPDSENISVKEDISYVCLFCKAKYVNETELESHKREAHIARIQNRLIKGTTVCRACIKRKKTREGLIKHIKSFHLLSLRTSQRVVRQIFICDTCYHVFFSKNMLILHIVSAHRFAAECPLECPKCIKGMKKRRYLKNHLKLHNILNVSVCHICFTKLNSNKVMAEHVKKNHNPYLRCDNCNFETNKMEHYQIHLAEEHKRSIKFESLVNVPMDVIDKCFAPRRAVSSNVIKFKYVPVTPLTGLNLKGLINICILCREICSTELEKREHIAKVHLDIPKPDKPLTHTCSCGEVFFNNVLLKHHIFKLKGDHSKVEEPTTSENVGSSEINVSEDESTIDSDAISEDGFTISVIQS